MKLTIVIISIILFAGVKADALQCILGLSSAYFQIAPKTMNMTDPKEIISTLFTENNINLMKNSLQTCGIDLPEIKFDQNLTKTCVSNMMVYKEEAAVFFNNVKQQGFTNQTLENIITIVQSFKTKDIACIKASNSLNVNGKAVFEFPVNENTTTPCLSAVVDIIYEIRPLVSNLTTSKQVFDFFHSNATKAKLALINSQCRIKAPSINYDRKNAEKCQLNIQSSSDIVMDLYNQYYENGFQQTLVLQAMGILGNIQQSKEACTVVYESIEWVPYVELVEKNNVLTQDESESDCTQDCLDQWLECKQRCNKNKFCQGLCDKDLAPIVCYTKCHID